MNAKLMFGGAALSALIVCNAQATTLLSDTFDGYADQAAFVAVWPVVGALPSGTLSSAQSVSPPNSIFNVGTAVAAEAMRNQRSFAESGTPDSLLNLITFSFDFHDGNALASPYRSHSNLQDSTLPGSYGQLVAMGLNNNQTSAANGGNYYMGRILGYTPPDTGGTSGSFFKLNDVGAPLRSDGWHKLAVVISSLDFKFYVDGILSETVLQTGTLRSYDHVRLGSGLSNAGNASYFDNVLIETNPIPEPSTVALAVLGGAALCFVLIRRRK